VGELKVMHVHTEPPAMVGLPLPKSDAPLDYVSAHMLFNLAAMRGSVEAKVYRKELSQEMGSGDVAEAQRAAREWLSHG
jgi:TPR repeat protein